MSEFYQNLKTSIKPLLQRLKENHLHLIEEHTGIIKQVKTRVKELICLGILHADVFHIIKTEASDIGYDGILKQKFNCPFSFRHME